MEVAVLAISSAAARQPRAAGNKHRQQMIVRTAGPQGTQGEWRDKRRRPRHLDVTPAPSAAGMGMGRQAHKSPASRSWPLLEANQRGIIGRSRGGGAGIAARRCPERSLSRAATASLALASSPETARILKNSRRRRRELISLKLADVVALAAGRDGDGRPSRLSMRSASAIARVSSNKRRRRLAVQAMARRIRANRRPGRAVKRRRGGKPAKSKPKRAYSSRQVNRQPSCELSGRVARATDRRAPAAAIAVLRGDGASPHN